MDRRFDRHDTKGQQAPSLVEIEQVDEMEKPTLRALMDDYLTELAALEHSEVEEDGEGHVAYEWFEAYWTDRRRTPFAILVKVQVCARPTA